MMRRFMPVAVVLLAAISVFATDRFSSAREVSIATTGRIVRINAKSRSMTVRSSEAPSERDLSLETTSWQWIGPNLPEITLRGGIAINLPRLANKPSGNRTIEYTVVTTSETTFQDGATSIQLEDFKTGETVSIHGVLNGTVLTASRLAKWD
jgi:hypothetical protein